MDTKILSVIINNIKNSVYEELFLRTQINISKPVQIYGLVNERCNCKCLMCDFWSRKEPAELSTEIWESTLLGLKKLCGSYHINFSGGEPFLRKDMFYLLEVCKKNGILFGITTNGYLLNEKRVDKLIDLKPFNVNISLDGIKEETHDYLRNKKGLFKRILKGIDLLLQTKKKKNSNTRIILKPAVCRLNLDELVDIVTFAQEKNLTGVNFQPIFKWTDYAEKFWITDMNHLEDIVQKLIDMKKKGYPILTSEQNIKSWVPHFKEEKIDSIHNKPCLVGVRNFQIRAEGNVYLCSKFPPIGNITEMTASEIWHSKKAMMQRKAFLNCNQLCLNACVAKKTAKDKIDLFFKLMRGNKAKN